MAAYRVAVAASGLMLAADKLLLRANIKQNAVQLREKELKLHYENFNAVGTQAAVLAGFAMTALAEVTVPPSCEQVRRPVRCCVRCWCPARSRPRSCKKQVSCGS